jgi:hypothetical protein
LLYQLHLWKATDEADDGSGPADQRTDHIQKMPAVVVLSGILASALVLHTSLQAASAISAFTKDEIVRFEGQKNENIVSWRTAYVPKYFLSLVRILDLSCCKYSAEPGFTSTDKERGLADENVGLSDGFEDDIKSP